MAIIYATQSGNWSNPSTWVGGVVPTSVDDVFSNNRTITIDVDITAITLRNTSNTSPAITQGGSFVVTGGSGTRNITLTGTSSSVAGVLTGLVGAVSPLLNITATGSAITNINSNLIGGGAGGPTNNPNVVINGNSTVNVVGRVGPPSQFVNAITSQSPGATLTVVGNIFGGPSSNGINITQAATVTATGDLTGNTTTATGNAIIVGAASTINVTGNLFGGAGTSAQAILTSVAGSTINVVGNLTAATGEALGDINTLVINAFNITGNSFASSARPAVFSLSTTLVTINGNMINTSSVNAVLATRMRISPTAQQSWTFQTSGSDRQLLTTNAFTNYPSVNDVRFGVTYSNLGSLTGTAYIPIPETVALGVPVGPTATGTALVTREQLIRDMGALIAGFNS